DAADFFVGPLESALEPDEVAIAATFPHPPPRSGSSWAEIARRHGDYGLVGVGALVVLDEGGCVAGASACLISVGGTPVLVDVTAAGRGATYDAVDWRVAVDLVDDAIDPDGDIHATADYRRQLSRVLTMRALVQATGDAVARSVA
ncbi:MAG: xanthine dehydrogenase family protein subunit M, partial [Actinomycetota bacterium]|nr:xanthine dehydrogenase family protein subunit M [Actinomycetota bacterium]